MDYCKPMVLTAIDDLLSYVVSIDGKIFYLLPSAVPIDGRLPRTIARTAVCCGFELKSIDGRNIYR